MIKSYKHSMTDVPGIIETHTHVPHIVDVQCDIYTYS